MKPSPCHNVLCFEWHLDIAGVLEAADEAGWSPAAIAGGGTRPEGPLLQGDVRQCHISRGIPAEIVSELTAAVVGVGHYSYGFDVRGLSDADPAFVMRYGPSDHFAWHVDNGIEGPPMGSRKLSFSVQLSHSADYDGGDLEFATYSHTYNQEIPGPSQVLRQRGNLIIFPSFMLHRVTPVTRGVRYAIVGWVHGPAFK